MEETKQPLPKIWIDERTEDVYLGDKLIEGLSKMQQVILRFLVKNALVRHNQYTLMDLVWPDPETHKESTPNALQAHIFQIRKRIEPDPTHPNYLITWYGRPGGYQFFPEGRHEVVPVAQGQTAGSPEDVWLDETTNNLHQGQPLIQGLSDRQFTLLRYMVQHPFIKHTREDLINLGWSDKERQKGVNPGALQAHIVQIRKRIEPDFSRPRFLVTWHGQETTGYQFFPAGKAELPIEGRRNQSPPDENEFWFDEETQNLYRGQWLVRGLSERQFHLVHYMIQNPMVKHTRHTLVSQAWSEEERQNGVTRNALQVHIYQIRKKIEPDSNKPRYLLSWPGKPGGYCFVPDGKSKPVLEEPELVEIREGKIWFDEVSQGLYRNDSLIEGLSEKQYTILCYLARYPNTKHLQDVLIEQIYDEESKNKDAAIKSLYRYIEQIRKKIEPDSKNPKYLVTWHGRPGGYEFFPDGKPDSDEVNLGGQPVPA